MRRGNKRKFHRTIDQRTALFKALATALLERGRIRTTCAKAKSLASYIEKSITTAKKQTLASRRLLATQLGTKAVKQLMDEVSPKFKDINGGYTRVINLGQRQSDGAPMAMIEFTHQ